MTLTEFQDSIRRVLGADLPLGEATRLSRYGFQARQAERYRDGRILLAGDAAHLFPATGIGINAGMLDAVNLAWKLAAAIDGWAPAGLLDTYHDERHFAGARAMLHTQAQVALRRGHDPAAEALRELFQELLARRAAVAPHGRAYRRYRHPLPDARPRPPCPDRHLRPRPHFAHRPGHHQRRRTHAPRPARPPRPRRPRRTSATPPDDWEPRVDLRTAETDHPPADALLIRPDARIAWAASIGEPGRLRGPRAARRARPLVRRTPEPVFVYRQDQLTLLVLRREGPPLAFSSRSVTLLLAVTAAGQDCHANEHRPESASPPRASRSLY